MGLVIINCAVDSLYLSFKGVVKNAVLDDLVKLKEKAQELSQNQPFEIGKKEFAVLPKGAGFYPFVLLNGDCTIKLTPSACHPTVYVEINAVYLYALGHSEAVRTLKTIVAGFGSFESPKVSRIDLCVDFQGWVPLIKDLDNFVSRVNKEHDWKTNGKLSAVYFGQGDLVGRLYNKTLEIAEGHGKKEWFYEIWKKSLYFQEEMEIWRAEIQIRREGLKTFECGVDVEKVFDHLKGMWKYLTDEWLTLRIPKKSTRKDRWPLDKRWKALQAAEFDGGSCSRIKGVKKLGDLMRYVARGRGVLESIGAMQHDSDLYRVNAYMLSEIEDYYRKFGLTFAGESEKRKLEKTIEPF